MRESTSERSDEIIKLKTKLLIVITVFILIIACIAGHTYAISNKISKLNKRIEENEEIVTQIEQAQTELHEAAEALRQPQINDTDLAQKLSDKWMELEELNKTLKDENTEASQEVERLQEKYLGNFELTAYCCGYITSTGTTPRINHTIAVDPRVIPYGSKVYIEGYGTFVAEDTGGVIKGNIIDIYMSSYDECIQFGRRRANVFLSD